MKIRKGVNFDNLHRKDNYKSIVLWGGRGSGKSHDCIDYFYKNILDQKFRFNQVVSRRHDRHVRSTFDYFKTRLFDYPAFTRRILKFTSSPMRIINKKNGSIIFFEGLDNPDNSIKGLPKLNKGWFEEASEGDADRYMTLYNTIRDGDNTRLICSFNPVSANNWTKRFFFDGDFSMQSSNYHSTVEDNPYISREYKDDLKALKDVDRVRYEVDYLGKWGVLTELAYFKNVELIAKIPSNAPLVGVGIDFGIVDPTVVCKTYIYNGDIYIETCVNHRNLPTTSPDNYNLVKMLRKLNISIPIQADSEDKTSIHTLRAHGLDVIPAIKGPGSILGGIRKLMQFGKIYILNNEFGESAHSDFVNYHRKKTPSGIILDDPAEGQEDHTIDAVRYSLSRSIVQH